MTTSPGEMTVKAMCWRCRQRFHFVETKRNRTKLMAKANVGRMVGWLSKIVFHIFVADSFWHLLTLHSWSPKQFKSFVVVFVGLNGNFWVYVEISMLIFLNVSLMKARWKKELRGKTLNIWKWLSNWPWLQLQVCSLVFSVGGFLFVENVFW